MSQRRRLSPRRFVFILLTVAVLVAFVFLISRLFSNPSRRRIDLTAPITRGDITRTVQASGTLDPLVLVNVGTQVSGTVQSIEANFNSIVHKGQVLLRLDPTLFQAQVDLDRANLESAEANARLALLTYKRDLALLPRDFVSQETVDQAKATWLADRASIDVARAQLKSAETNLSYSVIRSPINGVVIDREVEVGQTVAASFQTPTLFLIAQSLGMMRIDTYVSEANLAGIAKGDPVTFTVYAYPGRIFHGVVTQVRMAPITVQNVVTYDVIVEAPNPRHRLIPGMTATVTIVTGRVKNVLRVPRAALDFNPPAEPGQAAPPHGPHVWILGPNRQLRPIPVQVGLRDQRYAEVTGPGLRPGLRVVIARAVAGNMGLPFAPRGP